MSSDDDIALKRSIGYSLNYLLVEYEHHDVTTSQGKTKDRPAAAGCVAAVAAVVGGNGLPALSRKTKKKEEAIRIENNIIIILSHLGRRGGSSFISLSEVFVPFSALDKRFEIENMVHPK